MLRLAILLNCINGLHNVGPSQVPYTYPHLGTWSHLLHFVVPLANLQPYPCHPTVAWAAKEGILSPYPWPNSVTSRTLKTGATAGAHGWGGELWATKPRGNLHSDTRQHCSTLSVHQCLPSVSFHWASIKLRVSYFSVHQQVQCAP